MHELALAQSLLTRVLEEARKQGSRRVKSIQARIGEGGHPMSADSLRDALELASRGSIAEGAEVAIEVLPNTMRCKDCRHTFSAAGNAFLCPHCRGGRLEELDAEELLELQVE